MEKDIWVIADNRTEMLEAQHRINATGSMRAICVLSYEALERLLFPCKNIPSLIIVDYEMSKKEEFRSLSLLKKQGILAGIPMFFMTDNRDGIVRDECYRMGALAVLKKPFSEVSVERIEHMAWQFDVAKNAEKKLEQQSMDLKTAREIERLNKQLYARNELLYQVFGRYFSDEIVERIFDDPGKVSIGGEKREMTVMMADLRGFTAISQALDSDALMDLLNYYFGKMVEVIRKYRGTVIEFLGDGILAVFGAPITVTDHTENALTAAIVMQNTMNEVNRYCEEKGFAPLHMGIGIHRGEAFIGNIGSDKVMRYNVIGRVVNECSRIEGYSVGGQVLVSENTIKQVKCGCTTKPLVEIRAKGVEKPILVHEVVEVKGKYLCGDSDGNEQVLCSLKEPLYLEIYSIANKMIGDDYIGAMFKTVSMKNAIVEYEESKELELYSDVKIIGRDMQGKLLFEDVYAKIIEKDGNRVRLHFTHMKENFQRLLERNGSSGEEVFRVVVAEDKFAIECTQDMQLLQADSDTILCRYGHKYALLIYEESYQVQLVFVSGSKRIRAIEMMEYMLAEFGLVKGNAVKATGCISLAILKSKIADAEMDGLTEYFEAGIREYVNNTECIVANEYAAANEESIRTLPLYSKRNVKWAVVKSTDIAPVGENFIIKSLENESGVKVTVSDNTYIMIGCRGEIYEITAEKFANTYELSNEKLDIFREMLEFIPEVRLISTGEYISIDDRARICYPKMDSRIYARQLSNRTKVFQGDGSGEYFLGREGDYMAVRADDIRDIYIIQRDIFEYTYEQ